MGIQNVLGVNYPYPDTGDKPWGVEHIDWATAVSNATNTLNAAIGSAPADIAQLQIDVAALQANSVQTSSNSGTGEGIALPKVGTDLPFKSITAGPNIVLTASATELNIDSVAAGTGDVVGPASAIDNNIAVYDGITGKLIKDGGYTIAALLAQIPTFTKWGETAWTPTGSWVSNATYTGIYRRGNDTLEAKVNIALSGPPTSTSLNINIPAGLTINSSKLVGATLSRNVLGHGVALDASSTGEPVLVVRYNNTTSVRVYYDLIGSVWLDGRDRVDGTAPVTWANGDTLMVYFSVPILEWA